MFELEIHSLTVNYKTLQWKIAIQKGSREEVWVPRLKLTFSLLGENGVGDQLCLSWKLYKISSEPLTRNSWESLSWLSGLCLSLSDVFEDDVQISEEKIKINVHRTSLSWSWPDALCTGKNDFLFWELRLENLFKPKVVEKDQDIFDYKTLISKQYHRFVLDTPQSFP